MDGYNIFLIAIILICLFQAIKIKPIPAITSDWCVVFRIDKINREAHLWFYPILAFKINGHGVTPITSQTREVNELLSKKNKEGELETYARWLRDGAVIECNGFPDTLSFSDLIGIYIFDNYKLNFVTSIPNFYLSIINKKQKSYMKSTNTTHN
jgi:hypothetical protein